jgi:hypothetical protein
LLCSKPSLTDPRSQDILSVTGSCTAKTAEHDPITLPENWHKHCTNDIWKSSLDDLQGAKRRGGNHEDGWQLCELIYLSSFIILYFVYIRFYIYIYYVWGITVCIYIYILYIYACICAVANSLSFKTKNPIIIPSWGTGNRQGLTRFLHNFVKQKSHWRCNGYLGGHGVLYTSIDGLKAIYNPVVHHFPIFFHFKMPFSVGVKKNLRDFSGPVRMT